MTANTDHNQALADRLDHLIDHIAQTAAQIALHCNKQHKPATILEQISHRIEDIKQGK